MTSSHKHKKSSQIIVLTVCLLIGVIAALLIVCWLAADSGWNPFSALLPHSTECTPSAENMPPSGDPSVTSSAQSSEPIVVDAVARFSGQYVEDGQDDLVQNVAAILVTNNSDRHLDLASLTYDIGGQSATFVITGLPAGRSAWVMEANRLSIAADAEFNQVDCVTAFRSDAVVQTDMLRFTPGTSSLTAENRSDQTLKDVRVYYKAIHDDGNFFGGITYMVAFGDIAPGSSVEAIAGHFLSGQSEIVRVSWQTD